MSFDSLGLSADLLRAVSEQGYTEPTPIQSKAIPIILQGKDVMGGAQTGTGKTAGFTLPLLQRLNNNQVNQGKRPVRALVLTPTRELAAQVGASVETYGRHLSLRSTVIFGGVKINPQIEKLRQGVDILVATPGRLLDHVSQKTLDLSQIEILVLDEADRMLDMGFQPVIRAIARQIRSDRQTLMFSATWPMEVSNLAHEFLRGPYSKVTVGSDDLSASHSVKQIVEVCEPDERDGKLIGLLGKYHKSRKNRILIFVLYKKEAARVEQFLNRKGFPCVAVHGDMGQRDREKSVKQFHAGEVPLLVATDVAARGLDIPDVEYVMNYSFPLTVEDYVHRIGRTGRAGKSGISHTFFTVNDKVRSGELIGVLREAKQEIPQELYKFGTTIKKKESKLYGAHFKEVDLSKKGKHRVRTFGTCTVFHELIQW